MRVQLRIVAGTLRGRKLSVQVGPGLRPAPERLRQALFNILGDVVQGRPFVDVFAGTGAVGLEALSRGAEEVTFVERDVRTASVIEQHLREFRIEQGASVLRADAYRWAKRWQPPAKPVNVFLGPPYPDLERRLDELLEALASLQEKVAEKSLLVVQVERGLPQEKLPGGDWERRSYGRNQLYLWVRRSGRNDAGDHD